MIVRSETGVSSASDVKDRAVDITTLIERVDTKLLLTVSSALKQHRKVRPFVAALQEFQISDKGLLPEFWQRCSSKRASTIDRPCWPEHALSGPRLILMTGRLNYEKMSRRLGLGTLLVDSPDEANSPQIAARILCAFFVDAQPRLKAAFENSDVGLVYRVVAGSRPPERFAEAYGKLLAQL